MSVHFGRRALLAGAGAAALLGGAGAVRSIARMGSLDDYAAAMSAMRAPLPAQAQGADLVRFAALAANGHNTQPWRFRVSERSIRIVPDFARRTPVVDPDDHHLYVSLGGAAENLMLAARARAQSCEMRVDTEGESSIHISLAPGRVETSQLFEAIAHRQSVRLDYDGRAVSPSDLDLLRAAARVPDVETILIVDRAALDRVRDLVVAANSVQMADRAFVVELKDWIRFNASDALERGDGLFASASGNPTLPSWIGPLVFDLAFTAASENDKYARQMATSAGVAVFVGAHANPADWVQVGRACQRFLLQATALGIKCAFLNQPVEVAEFRPELAALVGMPGVRPDIVVRFGYGPDLPMSPRRPPSAIIDP